MYWKLKWCQTNRSMKKFWYFEYHSIQRMTKSIKFEKKIVSCQFISRQFSIRAVFVMTINKSQKQSLRYVDVDIRIRECFIYNQLYVVLFKIIKKCNFHMINSNELDDLRISRRIRNIQWKKILLFFNIFNQLNFSYFTFFSLLCFSNEFKIRWLIMKIHHDAFHWFFSLEIFSWYEEMRAMKKKMNEEIYIFIIAWRKQVNVVY